MTLSGSATLHQYVHVGDAENNGRGRWFFGDSQPIGSAFYHNDVFIKYGVHQMGAVCQHPDEPVEKINISILVCGGSFQHSFKDTDHNKLGTATLSKVGHFVIYGPEVLHSWGAIGKSTVVTIQIPPPSQFWTASVDPSELAVEISKRYSAEQLDQLRQELGKH